MKKILALVAAVMLMAAAFTAFAEEQVFDWGGMGNVKLTQVADFTEDMGLMVDEKPTGKFVVVVLSIQDGAEMDPSAAMDLAKETVTLDGITVAAMAGRGAKVDLAAGKAVLVGDIVAFFDVPVDYDVSGAVVKINGTEAAIPAAAEK